MNGLPLFLTTKGLAELLHSSPRTVEDWRRKKRGPDYIKLPTGQIRYPRESVLQFLGVFRPQGPTGEIDGPWRGND